MDSICLKAGICGIAIPGSCHVTTAASLGRSAAGHAMPVEKDLASVAPYKRSGPSGFSFKYPLRSLWPGGGRKYDAIALDDAVLVEERAVDRKEGRGREGGDSPAGDRGIGRNGKGSENWVLKILQVGSVWGGEGKDEAEAEEMQRENEENDGLCRVEDEGDDVDRIEFDRSSFSKLLRRVSLAEARLYTQMSYLGNLTYCIPQIKPKNLLKFHGMRFVTSSLEKKEMAVGAEKEQAPAEAEVNDETSSEHEKSQVLENKGSRINPSAAYQIAASAASYLHAHTKSIISFKSSKSELTAQSSEENCETNGSIDVTDDEMASLMATTDSMTAVVAAKEEVKQAVADDLNSACSSPCEWFICDDDITHTRNFVIQGSESIASWQANLLFEPIQFEGLDVPVHRGIYEAAKGTYKQLLPEVCAHLKSHGDRAMFRFTGHSLGGSLSLLINLMLLRRQVVPPSSLLPVITFGAPSIMCGGDRLLQELGLPRSHVQSITMHRDIVPRAFSCNYPNHVAELLKAVNGNFRDHPCLKNEKLLYAPMGEFLILQPDEKSSPNHELLPPGSGLYLLTCPASDVHEGERQLRAAQSAFLNSPHPLEILSDRSAYGSDGTVQRDHDMSLYFKSIRSVVRQELNQIRRARRTHHRKFWWPLVTLHALDGGTLEEGIIVASREAGPQKFDFSGIFQTGRRYLTHFSRLVASQNVHLLVVLLFPARLLFFSTYSLINLVN